MITTAATWLIGKGVAKRFAKPLILVALALLVVGVLAGAKCAYDASVIEKHENKQAVKDLKQTIKRERHANTEDAKAEQRDEERAVIIQREIIHATEKHPEAAASSAGPVAQSVLDELRRQGGAEQRGE